MYKLNKFGESFKKQLNHEEQIKFNNGIKLFNTRTIITENNYINFLKNNRLAKFGITENGTRVYSLSIEYFNWEDDV